MLLAILPTPLLPKDPAGKSSRTVDSCGFALEDSEWKPNLNECRCGEAGQLFESYSHPQTQPWQFVAVEQLCRRDGVSRILKTTSSKAVLIPCLRPNSRARDMLRTRLMLDKPGGCAETPVTSLTLHSFAESGGSQLRRCIIVVPGRRWCIVMSVTTVRHLV